MNVLIDDHLLREVLLGQEPTWLRRRRRNGRMATTGSWYYRLCSALNEPALIGSLSGPIAALPEELRTRVVAKVSSLPPVVGLVSMREIAWNAAMLGRRHGLNLLAAEALAAAAATTAAIAMGSTNVPPRLAAAARAERIRLLSATGSG